MHIASLLLTPPPTLTFVYLPTLSLYNCKMFDVVRASSFAIIGVYVLSPYCIFLSTLLIVRTPFAVGGTPTSVLEGHSSHTELLFASKSEAIPISITNTYRYLCCMTKLLCCIINNIVKAW